MMLLIIVVQLVVIGILLTKGTESPKITFINSTQDFGTIEKGELDVVQKRFVLGFQCDPLKLALFKDPQTFITKKNMKMFKAPYPQLILLQPKNQPLPTYHYP